MVLFSAIGLLIWIAFLFVAVVVYGIIWASANLAFWLTGLSARPTQPKSRLNPPPGPPVRQRSAVPPGPAPLTVARVPERPPAQLPAASDIWPKWTPSYRRYVDQEKSLWQEQFDALIDRRL